MNYYLKHSAICVTVLLFLGSCVQQKHLKTITLTVDMKNVSQISNPGVRGQFTNPSWETTIPLTDTNNDSIYEVKVAFKTAQNDVSFKFVNNDTFELQHQDNRKISLAYKPETLVYEAVFDISEAKTIRD